VGTKKVVEDFECMNCEEQVVGNGYTNHCPACLHSCHVDNVPGDRASKCLGLMKPVELEATTDGFRIIHECIKCGHIKPNKTSPEDNLDSFYK